MTLISLTDCRPFGCHACLMKTEERDEYLTTVRELDANRSDKA